MHFPTLYLVPRAFSAFKMAGEKNLVKTAKLFQKLGARASRERPARDTSLFVDINGFFYFVNSMACHKCIFSFQFKSVENQMTLREHVTSLRFLLSDESLQHREELQQRIQVEIMAIMVISTDEFTEFFLYY